MSSKNYTYNFNDIIEQLKCYSSNCENEYRDSVLLKQKVINASNIVIEAYKNKDNDKYKKLTKQEFIDKMMQIRKIQFDSEVFNKFSECFLNKCYNIHEKLFDNIIMLLDKMYNVKYKKPSKYTLKEYKKLMMTYIKVKEIMPIANSQ
jgi:hypothetical protein